jgi:hypothetical protein
MMLYSKSAANINSKGERGSPYLTPPLLLWNIFNGTPLRRIDDVTELIIIFIHCCHLTPNPLCCSTSNLRNTTSFLLVLHKYKYSNTQARQSCIFLFLMKSYWFLWIIPRIIFWSLLASNFVRSLTLDFSSEMDLKSPTLVGLSFFWH